MVISRRAFVAGVGSAAAAGMAAPATAAAHRIGVAREASDAFDVIGTIVQDGPRLTGFGWLTRVAGLADGALFTDPAQRGAATARLTWHAEGTVTGRDVLQSLFSVTADGRLRIFLSPDGGAQLDTPATFAAGRLVARYAARLHSVLTVIAPDQAITQLTGELRQREAPAFRLGGAHRLGRPGLLARLTASGPGTRSDAAAPRATFHVGGGVVVPG